MLNLAPYYNLKITDTPCWRKLFYDTTAEKVMVELNKLKPGESYVVNGRVKGKLVIGDITFDNVRFVNTRIVAE